MIFLQYRKLGNTGIELSAIGFGCMRLPPDNSLAIPLMRRAVELGINYFETSTSYCQNRSEIQLGLAVEGMRDDVHISTKSHVHMKGERSFGGLRREIQRGKTLRTFLRSHSGSSGRIGWTFISFTVSL